MRKISLILFFFILSEIFMIIAVTSILGFGITSLMVITSTVFGIWMCRSQGFRSFHQVKVNYVRGIPFQGQLLGSAGSLVSGLLLIIPGLITTLIGLIILIPGLKTFIFHRMLWYLSEKFLPNHTKHNAAFSYDDSAGTVVDGEYYETTTQNHKRRSNEQSHKDLEKS